MYSTDVRDIYYYAGGVYAEAQVGRRNDGVHLLPNPAWAEEVEGQEGEYLGRAIVLSEFSREGRRSGFWEVVRITFRSSNGIETMFAGGLEYEPTAEFRLWLTGVSDFWSLEVRAE